MSRPKWLLSVVMFIYIYIYTGQEQVTIPAKTHTHKDEKRKIIIKEDSSFFARIEF
jgi:hypothetical protein